MTEIDYDHFLSYIYDYSPYFGKERKERDYATRFYLDALRGINDKILEFGTCTGIHTIPIARSSHMLDSVDISPYIHKIVMDKLSTEPMYVHENINLHLCNVFDYTSTGEYPAIILPDSFLFAIADKEKQFKLLSICNKLLRYDGIIIFDVFYPWVNIIKEGAKKQCSRFRGKNGEVYIVYTDHYIDKINQLHKFNFKHELWKSDVQYYHTITYRYMFKEEIESMLRDCGFEILQFDTTFNYSKSYAVIAKKISNKNEESND